MVRVVLIGFALLTAAAAGWMVKLYLSAQREQLAEMAQQQVPKPIPTIEVLVVTGDLDVAAVLSSGDLRWQAWPDVGLNAHYITRRARPDALEKLVGAAARQPLFAGEPVSEDKLVLKQSGGFLAAVLPQGGRAITLRVDEATGVAGLIIPGDHVDVILTHEVPVKVGESGSGAAPEKRFVGETIVHDLTVLAIDQELRRDDKAAKLGKTVTLAVDVGQAEAIALGRSLGNLTLSLRSAFGAPGGDDRLRPFTAATDISGALREADRPPGPALALPTSVPPARPYTVTVYHGLTAETVTLPR